MKCLEEKGTPTSNNHEKNGTSQRNYECYSETVIVTNSHKLSVFNLIIAFCNASVNTPTHNKQFLDHTQSLTISNMQKEVIRATDLAL